MSAASVVASGGRENARGAEEPMAKIIAKASAAPAPIRRRLPTTFLIMNALLQIPYLARISAQPCHAAFNINIQPEKAAYCAKCSRNEERQIPTEMRSDYRCYLRGYRSTYLVAHVHDSRDRTSRCACHLGTH